MKKLLIVLSLLATSGVAMAATGALEQVRSKIKFTEGSYDLRSKDAGCEEGYVELELVGDDDNVTLRLGEKVAFANLEKPTSHHEAEKGCSFDYTTKFGDNEINQVTKYECPKNKKANYVYTQKIQFAGADLNYTSKVEGASAKQLDCKYALAPEKKGSK
jgi:hypothetical protein